MKYVQVIDGANNCIYPVYGCEENDFLQLFPDGREVEFIEDFVKRVGSKKAHEVGCRLWGNLADKKKIKGLHGTLFCELWYKKQYFLTPEEWERAKIAPPKVKDRYGHPDEKGRIWVPTGWGTGLVHGGPHWDVRKPEGGHDNVFPGRKIIPKSK